MPNAKMPRIVTQRQMIATYPDYVWNSKGKIDWDKTDTTQIYPKINPNKPYGGEKLAITRLQSKQAIDIDFYPELYRIGAWKVLVDYVNSCRRAGVRIKIIREYVRLKHLGPDREKTIMRVWRVY